MMTSISIIIHPLRRKQKKPLKIRCKRSKLSLHPEAFQSKLRLQSTGRSHNILHQYRSRIGHSRFSGESESQSLSSVSFSVDKEVLVWWWRPQISMPKESSPQKKPLVPGHPCVSEN